MAEKINMINFLSFFLSFFLFLVRVYRVHNLTTQIWLVVFLLFSASQVLRLQAQVTRPSLNLQLSKALRGRAGMALLGSNTCCCVYLSRGFNPLSYPAVLRFVFLMNFKKYFLKWFRFFLIFIVKRELDVWFKTIYPAPRFKEHFLMATFQFQYSYTQKNSFWDNAENRNPSSTHNNFLQLPGNQKVSGFAWWVSYRGILPWNTDIGRLQQVLILTPGNLESSHLRFERKE